MSHGKLYDELLVMLDQLCLGALAACLRLRNGVGVRDLLSHVSPVQRLFVSEFEPVGRCEIDYDGCIGMVRIGPSDGDVKNLLIFGLHDFADDLEWIGVFAQPCDGVSS